MLSALSAMMPALSEFDAIGDFSASASSPPFPSSLHEKMKMKTVTLWLLKYKYKGKDKTQINKTQTQYIHKRTY